MLLHKNGTQVLLKTHCLLNRTQAAAAHLRLLGSTWKSQDSSKWAPKASTPQTAQGTGPVKADPSFQPHRQKLPSQETWSAARGILKAGRVPLCSSFPGPLPLCSMSHRTGSDLTGCLSVWTQKKTLRLKHWTIYLEVSCYNHDGLLESLRCLWQVLGQELLNTSCLLKCFHTPGLACSADSLPYSS